MSYMDIQNWSKKKEKLEGLIEKLNPIFSPCEDLSNHLHNSAMNMDGNQIGNKQYDNGVLTQSYVNCVDIYNTVSKIIEAATKEIQNLKTKIENERTRLRNIEEQNKKSYSTGCSPIRSSVNTYSSGCSPIRRTSSGCGSIRYKSY